MTDRPLCVLMAASECAPFVKTGGLADVVGALPHALKKLGVSVSVILPFYKTLPKEVRAEAKDVKIGEVKMGWRKQYMGLKKYTTPDYTCYFIDNETYFRRDNLYGYYDDAERFIYFSLAVVEAIKIIGGLDVVHCHDWQTALVSTLFKKFYYNKKGLKDIKHIFTIHNLRFQGNLNLPDFQSFLGLAGTEAWLGEAVMGDQANLLKSALYSADAITTVSPNYANEIKLPYYGENLDVCIGDISNKLLGILNGIDTDAFNPADDPKIFWSYNGLAGKHKNKDRFLYEYNMPNDGSMMIGMVTRLDPQKGLDLVLYAIDKIMQLPVHFVLLGTGSPEYEKLFGYIEQRYPDRVRCFITYDDELAHRIYAASDAFLMPSNFEPCGLGQLIAMRYGTLPIVRSTGGLADTVIPYNPITGEGTGFSFNNYNGDEMLDMVKLALDVYTYNKSHFNEMALRAMAQEFSWTASAKKYLNIYQNLVETVPVPKQKTLPKD
ncbi:MAG: glycogen synthase [Eubacteriales bacterium]